jgi:hypothetical protein
MNLLKDITGFITAENLDLIVIGLHSSGNLAVYNV